ncbi:MAG: GntR family transcriptional regulator [Anaerolineaceae bacterium]|nr:GntR family transcriptional regulator [Anaerolineaceae bacterium]
MNHNGAIPLYYQLKIWLLEQIDKGIYTPGDQIPTEVELCEQFNLSRGTVRQAIKELVNNSRLYLVRGRGTFVAQVQKTSWDLSEIVSMSQYFKNTGIDIETKVLEITTNVADGPTASNLKIKNGAEVMFIKRLRFVDKKPFVIFSSYLPKKLVCDLNEMDLTDKSLYQLLKDNCGLHVSSKNHTVSSRLATEQEAKLLNISHFDPVLLFTEIAFIESGHPIEYSQSVFNSDLGYFHFRSQNPLTG